jgi:predicted nuclease with RNAse H fold
MAADQPRQHFGLDLKSSFSTGWSTLWHDSPSAKPFRFKRTEGLLPFLRTGTPPTPMTVALDAPLTFAAAALFANRELIADDLSTLATVEMWRDANCWTKRPWEKVVGKVLVDDSLKGVLWYEKIRKNNRVDSVPVINVKGFGGLDLSIRGLWLRRLLEGLGFTLTDACGVQPLQLIEVHPALALALWWQQRRTTLFPNYKSAWRTSVDPLVALLKEVDGRTPDTFANDDALDCFVAWLIAWYFHENNTVTLGCVRDGFVVVPRTPLAVALAEKCRKGKTDMEKPRRSKKKAP